MNWKIFGFIWNLFSVLIWIVVLYFMQDILNFYFSILENDSLIQFQNYISIVIKIFVIFMIAINLITAILALKSKNKNAMLWLIGLSYFQFLLMVGLAIGLVVYTLVGLYG